MHHGVDISKYRCVVSDVRDRLDIPRQSPLVLFLGRLEARKGVYVLCDAIPDIIRRMPMTRFLLVGRDTNTSPNGGSVKSYLSEEAKGRGFVDNLVFIEFLSPDELITLYSTCDVFVLPSLQEGFSMVILEALACGKPIVATSAGGASDIGLMPPSGIIVPPNNAKELAQAIIDLLSLSEEDRKLVSSKNRELVESRFSIEAWVDEVIRVYEKALRKV